MAARPKNKLHLIGLKNAEPKMVPGAQTTRLDDWSPSLLKSQAYDHLLLDIITGVMEPGERIEEQNLAQRYNCGLAGIRDALARLSLEGLVQRRSRIGTTVAPLDILQVKQAFEARFLIETHCAGLAAVHATRSEIAEIKSAFDGAETAIDKDDFQKLVSMDRIFHFAVASASHNLELAKMVVTLHHKAARFWVYSMTSQTRQERIADVVLHRAAGAAIAARNVDKAQNAMLLVLGGFPDKVKRTLEIGDRRRRSML
jgi:DNA-binding GntR family transcriptional regulator